MLPPSQCMVQLQVSIEFGKLIADLTSEVEVLKAKLTTANAALVKANYDVGAMNEVLLASERRADEAERCRRSSSALDTLVKSPSWRHRTEEELLDTLSTLCYAIWHKTVPRGKHLWSIPVDRARDFDCIFGDAIRELVARRAG